MLSDFYENQKILSKLETDQETTRSG